MAINFKKPVARLISIPFPSLMRASSWRTGAAGVLLLAFGLVGVSTHVAAQTGSKIASTKHNLSKTGTGPLKATSETQVCVFCHTPHGASTTVKAPLWNRAANAQTYAPYTSLSLDANTIADGFSAQPGGSSLLCLSCHDGMVALGNVNVSPRDPVTKLPAALPIAGLTGTMPAGSYGSTSGFTRNLGTDLSNDHPISITYNDALALQDRELARLSTTAPAQRDIDTTGTLIGIRSTGYKPLLPLEPTSTLGAGQVQCATCHDPHLNKEKFLRLNRFQANAAPTATFIQANDQICLACHRKLGTAWSQSAHANTTSAPYVYKDGASLLRDFPSGASAKQVWQVACLNCHDTHTASGSRRLLREGTGTAPMAAASAPQPGSTITLANQPEKFSSIENTCYQCHTTTTDSILTVPEMTATSGVPDIKSEFGRTYRMPIRTVDQFGTGNTNDKEVHDITDANFMETDVKLGRGNTMNRHVECTDCHNPHRVIKNSLFNGLGSATWRTHEPSKSVPLDVNGSGLNGSGGNIASGVLRGAWGVEPSYAIAGQTTVTVSGSAGTVTGTKWPENPTFVVKKGDPGALTSTERTATYLTREYQLCFKCHSNYANSDSAAGFPALGNTGGGTVSGTNSMTRYTNVAAEFAARATDPPTTGTDQGEATNVGTKCGGGDCAPVGSYPRGLNSGSGEINHRSWHPVVFPTGRDRAERAMGATDTINMRPPWDTNLGSQTMQCSDCHGNSASYTQGAGPVLTQAQGPHGSDTPFLLKGTWNTSVTLPSPGPDTLCGKCHNPGANGTASGYGGDHIPDSNMGGEPCMHCHIAVPHGWKNKAFLVNLRCVGQEVAGTTGDCQNRGSGIYGITTIAPYYISSRLRVYTWVRSGGWTSAACGSRDMEDSCPKTGN